MALIQSIAAQEIAAAAGANRESTASASVAATSAPWTLFDSRRAFGYLRRQVDFGPRVPGTDGHAQCLAWMEKQFQTAGCQTRLQGFAATSFYYGGKAIPCSNLYAVVNPSAAKRVALTAHWDTRPVADQDPDPANRATPIPGANDGASGVAVLMELANVFKSAPPAVGVVFVCFDAEDAGRNGSNAEWCLGARYAARNWPEDWPIAWGANLDMVGGRDLLIRADVESQARAPQLFEKIWRVGLERWPQVFSRRQWPQILDDHVPFLDAGKPFVDVIDFEYKAWHTVGDDVGQCAPRSLQIVGEVMAEVVYGEK
ncbi:MAG: M28 family peptidase [Candidatus Sumerlaeota bacterium]|nr:M28 family peptidase [Candidatus Sumerlaeota bacterium]